MKILIISDSHDNVANLEKVFAWAKDNGIEALIHAGDVCAPSVLGKVIASGFSGPIHLIFGNVGDPVLLKQVAEKFPRVQYYGEKGQFELDGKKIILVHELDKMTPFLESKLGDVIIYGHTHKAEVKTEDGVLIINPGTIGGLFAVPTFAVFDTETGQAEVKELSSV